MFPRRRVKAARTRAQHSTTASDLVPKSSGSSAPPSIRAAGPTPARLVVIGTLLGLCVLIVVARLVAIQLIDRDKLRDDAQRQQLTRDALPAFRGDVFDRYGRTLLHTLWDYSVDARPNDVRDRPATAEILADILEQPVEEMTQLLSSSSTRVTIDSHVSQVAANRLDEAALAGIDVFHPGRRVKLVDGFDLIGELNRDGKGVEGVESSLERELKGYSGYEVLHKDAHGRRVWTPGAHQRKEARHGNHVTLTIDSRLQWMVEGALARTVEDRDARGGTAIVVDVWTGEVLAMAAAGGRIEPRRRIRRLRAVEDLFEPGSTFKVVAFAAALDAGLLGDDSIYYAEQGKADFGGFTIRDTKKLGWICAADVFAMSSNICTAKIGEEIGGRLLHDYARAMGIGQRTGIELPGEQRGLLRGVGQWSGRSTATVAIGQEVSVTALQLVMAYASVANGGELLKPRLVREVTRQDGKVLWTRQREVVRRVMKPETAATLRRYATRAVERGTGRLASPANGMAVAGKTGTAQKAREDGPGYAPGKYVSCFAGFFPADSPQLALVVVIDEPEGDYYGGEVAAPLFAEIARETASIAAGTGSVHEPVSGSAQGPERVAVPDVRLASLQTARDELDRCGLRHTVVAGGTRVMSQDPPPGSWVPAGATVEIHCRQDRSDAMPDVQGLTLREALRDLRSSGLQAHPEGSGGRVIEQDPDPGSPLPESGECVLVLAAEL